MQEDIYWMWLSRLKIKTRQKFELLLEFESSAYTFGIETHNTTNTIINNLKYLFIPLLPYTIITISNNTIYTIHNFSAIIT